MGAASLASKRSAGGRAGLHCSSNNNNNNNTDDNSSIINSNSSSSYPYYHSYRDTSLVRQLKTDAATLGRKASCCDPKPGQKLKPIAELDSEALTKLEESLIKALDREFDPFAMQHNKRLIRILSDAVGVGSDVNGVSLLLERELREVTIDANLCRELGAAVASAVFRLPSERLNSLWQRHESEQLQGEANGHWHLKHPPECRLMRSLELHDSEDVGRPKVRILSQAAAWEMEDGSEEGRKRALRFGVSLRRWAGDVVCLQGLEPDLAIRSLGTSYRSCCSQTPAQAGPTKAQALSIPSCCVIWDERKWIADVESIVQASSGVALTLFCREDPSVRFRVATINPEISDMCMSVDDLDLWNNIVGESVTADPYILCAHFECIGGVEAAGLLPGLSGRQSLSKEVSGQELASPRLQAKGPFRDTWHPSAVFCKGVTTLNWLEGHAKGYLNRLDDRELEQRFPTGHPPIVATLRI